VARCAPCSLRAQETLQEAAAALDDLLGLVGPVDVVGRRADEEVEEPQASAPTDSKYCSGR
jgi:hypothetical protein